MLIHGDASSTNENTKKIMTKDKEQIIDLVHKENSTIDYEVITFPDGQIHFKMDNTINHKYPVQVKCRIRNGNELFLLLQVLDVLNRHGMKPAVHIYYLLAARMDRVMSFGEPFTAKVVLDLLDKYEAIYTIRDAHCSDLIFQRYNRYKFHLTSTSFPVENTRYVCYPDEGSRERCRSFGAIPIICEKARDVETGDLSGFQILEAKGYQENNQIMVLDDLCDGGGTFCGIIKELRKLNPSKVILQVTHAIQKQGIEKVAALYDEVYITNSYHDWDKEDLPKNVHVTDIIK